MVAVGARQIGIVKRSRADESERGALFGFAEDLSSALGAKAPVHGRAAVGLANVVAQRTGYRDIFLAEQGANRAGPAAEILAHPAPAIARAERRFRPDLVPHRPAQTSARDRHEKTPQTVPDHGLGEIGRARHPSGRVMRSGPRPARQVEIADGAEPGYKGSRITF